MSTYEWERGTIKIPAKEWAGFRTALIKAWNAEQEKLLEQAVRLHGHLKAATKGKRGSKRDEAVRAAMELHCSQDREENDAVRSLAVSYDYSGGKAQLMLKGLPKKKDLKLFPASKDAELYMGDATIVLRNADKTVTWDVGENNHARDHARRHPIAQKLFRLLERITWTRGSGGKIVGNDEYNRDADYEGGGGNYVTSEYGVEAQKRKQAAAKSYGGYGGSIFRR